MSRGYVAAENIQMLLSREATRAKIKAGLTEWLPENARPGDQITVFFAGHGSQMWDESGDEDDGLDETLAPADVSPTSTEFDISDDEFGSWLRNLPTNNVLVILDNCNSGTGTRDITPFSRSRQLGRDIQKITKPAAVARRALPGREDETGFDPSGVNVLEFAATQPHQAAVDAFFPGEGGGESFHGGAFTTYLVRELWRTPADMTYEEVFDRVRDALKRNRFEQDPHLSEDVSTKDLPLFFLEGGEGIVSEALLPVVAASDGTGYPRQIGAADIPVQTRLMTVSDIFDALTASDRPYKRALSADRALEILTMESDGGQLDPDIVELLIGSEVYHKILDQDWRGF